MNNEELKNTHDSFDRIVRKIFSFETKISVVRYLVAFLGVIAFGALMVVLQGEDPLNAAKLIVEGAFGSKTSIGNTLRWAMPCILTGIASIIATKSGVVNLGVEGQLYVGALTAAAVGWLIPMPDHLHAVVCILSAGVVGALWALIPALMRMFLNIDEYVTTMMMNFIATNLCDFITAWILLPMRGVITTTVQTEKIEETAKLTTLVKGTSLTTGFIVAIVVAILSHLMFKYTIFGYELKQVGDNLKYAKTGGVSVKKRFFEIFLISGFIAGICGGVEVCGGYFRYVTKFSTDMGWEGLMLAAIAANNSLSLIPISIIWGAMKTGSMAMERGTSLNRLTVNIMKMVFVILVAIDFEGIFTFFKERKERKLERAKLELQAKEENA